MAHLNYLFIKFPALPENIKAARMMAASFVTFMNPTVEEMDDVKTAVSEAVTNCIIHAYKKEERQEKEVEILLEKEEDTLTVRIEDKGKGIDNIARAMEPLYTSCEVGERSGMGFSFMEAFMDELYVESIPCMGTTVTMKKRIGSRKSELCKEEAV